LTYSSSGQGTWSFFGYIDKEEAKAEATATSGVSAARELFKNKTARGTYYYMHPFDCSS
jgi:hypothetical protein